MLFVQFRVHPAVGCARIGNSDKAYHLASEFPYFLQEAFPNLRFKPKPRVHPKKFFGADSVASVSPPGALTDYDIYEPTGAFENKFKEAEGKIGAPVKITGYVRFQLGEGIERQADDFASEVAKAAGAA